MHRPISRRAALKGFGTALALPALEAMLPRPLSAAAKAAPAAPTRLLWVYVPNGKHMADWTPAEVGADFRLPHTLEPLKPFQKDTLVLSGLTLDKARANGDGGGDHARAMSAFLTGRQPRKTDGASIRAGVSIDQVAADRLGRDTRFASLELGCEGGRQAGNCDSGYSCAYSSNLSWRGEATPNPKEIDPRLVFERLFGNSNRPEEAAARAQREAFHKSVLDFVREDAKRLTGKLGPTDRHKLDEYLSAVREIEVRIEKSKRLADAPLPKADLTKPAGVPKDFGEHIRLMYDLLALAFRTDLTRVATMVHANDGSNRPYPFLNISEGHHELSHHQNDPKKHDKIKRINRFHTEQFAYFLGKLAAVKEGDKTLLDRSLIVYGSGISDGNRHNHDDLPVLLVGGGNGTVTSGRHLKYRKETPLMNLYLSVMDRVGVKLDSHGDSNGRLADLS